ncbi:MULTISPECIES: cupin domain-containing protein [Prochlorococcus]|uniref:cupin domain-containing protein n=1 Tax=Prochlorococcus TaxID=1218 RepID=UPI0007B384E7|nr:MULTISPECIES: cupin domain-containing protein [Prochlorococcus]KZR84983.1 Cupin domain protein [Prochlorococcus marinus str. MIT 1327]KZR70693.1 Cupin domain protein [Prochlorococcus marinus str. MIT 1312]NMO84271.1 cupin domain-containing protein [Prochlorococcus sp. P1344]NMP06263.1 cupin domain-containing protein [Prochlorococcus sp. P1361]NMP12967.1 cupin domain-containing protein [Prochlorococcus sp.P1363]
MILRASGLAAASLLIFSGAALASPQPITEELFRANRTLGGRVVAYPEGTPEMRVYRITLPVGAKIPLHIHPSPVMVVVEQGRLSNVRIVDGAEVTDIVEAGDGFLEGNPEEPHYVVNKGSEPAVSLVTFASVEGMPNMVRVE